MAEHSAAKTLSGAQPISPAAAPPLCVDLDGTLVYTDTLLELAVSAVRAAWWNIFLLPLWLLKGKAYLKWRAARAGSIDPATLPYNRPFLHWLEKEDAAGRRIFLVTAANESFAGSVAAHAGCFDGVLASSESFNAAGANKLALLQARFGADFDYAGNAAVDLVIWRNCRKAIIVNAPPRVLRAARSFGNVASEFPRPERTLFTLAKALRVHQWAKNALIFVPLLAAHRFTNLHLLAESAIMFLAFSLCASSVYVVNDLLDVQSDRRHSVKRNRPIASGKISIPEALAALLACVAASATLLIWVRWQAWTVLAAYYITTFFYSLYLKRQPLIDVFTLSALYVLRIVCGHAATEIPYSPWLMSVATLFFLSLALCKRVSELWNNRNAQQAHVPGRGYGVADFEVLTVLGVSAGCMSVILFAIYTESQYVTELYRQPAFLMLFVPVLLFWISRIWLLAHRGQMNEDPILFAIRDAFSYLVLAVGALIFCLASQNWILLPIFRG